MQIRQVLIIVKSWLNSNFDSDLKHLLTSFKIYKKKLLNSYFDSDLKHLLKSFKIYKNNC